MAADTNALLGRDRRFEPMGRKNHRLDTEIAVLAIWEKACA